MSEINAELLDALKDCEAALFRAGIFRPLNDNEAAAMLKAQKAIANAEGQGDGKQQ